MQKSFTTILKEMFSLKADCASNEEIRDRLLGGGQITGTYMCVLICAMVIASVGLNTGSTATIIGAMLDFTADGQHTGNGFWGCGK